MPGKNGSNGQDSQSQTGDEDEDLDGTESEDEGQGDEEEEGSEGEGGEGKKPSGSDLERLTPEQKDAEILRLRGENARRRAANKTLREQVKAQEESRKGKKSADDLEKENKDLAGQILSLRVEGELRDFIAEKHPKYAKLTKRIAKFVDLEDVDLNDPESLRDAVSTAVEDFVKEVPLGGESEGEGEGRPVTDGQGRPVGSPGGTPARRSAGDAQSLERRKKLFPGIYTEPKA